MFKKSRKKIVAAIMSILVLLWVGTLGMIYAFSYFEMRHQNERMLRAHADMYVLPQSFGEMAPPNRPRPNDSHGFNPESPMFRLSTFYTVALTPDGEVLDIQNEQPTVHPNEALTLLAAQIASGGRELGTERNLAFYRVDKGGYTLVVFMDNTVVNESAMTLIRYTLIFGGAALILFFFVSILLARRIVNPLEASYRKQKQFISDAGHELKTPVAVVNANAELLAREIGENQWLQNIRYENERMGMLVVQLLELARTESVSPQMERVDFSRLVSGETLPFESVAFESGLELCCDIANEIAVEGNSTQLKQLVSILVDNAIRHSRERGEISLSLRAEHGMARLSVTNLGEAIPPEQREQIFERFYRADPARGGEEGHYGLGLAIAKAIVLSHKGHIEVRCEDGRVEFRAEIPTL